MQHLSLYKVWTFLISVLIKGKGHDKFALPEKTLNALPLRK